MKRKVSLFFSLVLCVCLVSCTTREELGTFTAETGLSPADVAGTWGGEDAPFSYLILSDDGLYTMLIAAEEKRGGVITEGEYVVLDGYGVDDPDLFLSLKFDSDNEALKGEEQGVHFTLSRTEITREETGIDPEAWYGLYSSDAAVLSIGPGVSEGTLLIAITPRAGATMSASLVIDSDTEASCGMITLTREENKLELTGIEEEFIPLSGTYVK